MMFVCSMKTTRPRLVGGGLVAALLLTVLVALSGGRGAVATGAPVAADDAARQQVLASLGYAVLPNRCEVREILIPAESDETFAAYNALQTAAGYDLTAYCGRRVKCWTYTVTNYPGEDAVEAHLYIYKDTVVGGDISSTAQDGFSHGLTPCPSAA